MNGGVTGGLGANVLSPAFVGFADSGPGALVERFNLYANSGVPQAHGAAFEASQYYQYSLAPPPRFPTW